METVLYYIIGFLGFVVAFGLAVFIHELGHFLAAKAFKVPVERFVVGMDKEAMGFLPRCIWEKKIGETTYGLSLIPLGGYVKMIGAVHPDLEQYFEESPKDDAEDQDNQNTDEVVKQEEKKETLAEQAMADQSALYQKPLWQKFIVYAGGVFMNLVLAMIIIAYISWSGETVDAPIKSTVGWMPAENVFAQSGLQQGDDIVALNGTPVATQDEFFETLSDLVPKGEESFTLSFTLTGERDGEKQEYPIEYDSKKNGMDLTYFISRDAYVDYVILNTPAYKAGIKKGDLIIKIGDEEIDDESEATHIVRNSPGLELPFLIQRGSDQIELTLTPDENKVEELEDKIGQMGVYFGSSEKITHSEPFMTAVVSAPSKVYLNVKRYVTQLQKIGNKLVHGEINEVRKQLGGPVAITQMAGYHANLGLEDFLKFLIMFNIALAVMNILPIPILDGGHIVMAVYESIFGKPIPPKILVPMLQGTFFLLIGFVLLVSLSDVLKIFTK